MGEIKERRLDTYDYTAEQMKQLLPVDQYGIQIKMKSTSGETKWLTIAPKGYEGGADTLNKIVRGLRSALRLEKKTKSFIITGTIKVRDKIDAEDQEQAERIMRAKYPGLLDKEVGITDVEEMK